MEFIGFLVNSFMKDPIASTWAFPKFDDIVDICFKELP